MRTAREVDAEEWVLSSAEGHRLLEHIGSVVTPGPAEIARWRRAWAREAAAHDLARLAAGVDYLTGPDLLGSPFLAAFEVRETLALDLRRRKRVLAERHLGRLEIKVRGLDLRPESLRAQLRPPGPSPATLLLVGGSGPSRAILAERQSR